MAPPFTIFAPLKNNVYLCRGITKTEETYEKAFCYICLFTGVVNGFCL